MSISNEPPHHLAQLDWDRLKHAYGNASDVPELLLDLCSSEVSKREEAVNELLYSRAYHQFDVFTCTPYVIKEVLPLLCDSSIASLPIYEKTLADEIINFCRICAEASPASPEIQMEIRHSLLAATPLFKKWTSGNVKVTANSASWLVALGTAESL